MTFDHATALPVRQQIRLIKGITGIFLLGQYKVGSCIEEVLGCRVHRQLYLEFGVGVEIMLILESSQNFQLGLREDETLALCGTGVYC